MRNAIILILLLLAGLVRADERKLQVFVFAGQSNMVGKRSRAEDLSNPQFREQKNLAFKDGQWLPVKPGNTQNPEYEGFGPEISFAQAMSEALGHPVGIIKYSVGGTNLAKQWNVESTAEDALYPKLKGLVEQARKKRDSEVVGLLWMQGEADSKTTETARHYAGNLAGLIARARMDFGNSDMFFVAGRINPEKEGFDPEGVRLVRTAFEECAVAGYAWVDCDDLPKVVDKVHYDTKGQEILGKRMAESMLKLMGDRPTTAPPATDLSARPSLPAQEPPTVHTPDPDSARNAGGLLERGHSSILRRERNSADSPSSQSITSKK